MDLSASQIRLVDDLCDRFEQAWKEGTPRLEDFLDEAPPESRGDLLRELLGVELHYRRSTEDGKCSLDGLRDLHPELAARFPTQFERDSQAEVNTQRGAANDPQSDVQLVASRASHGLHIRCPHCCHPVELLIDSPEENVTCHSCGGGFSLAGDADSAAQSAVLQTIGRFDLISRVGVGGFGTVWKSRDRELDRIVALKIPRQGHMRSNEFEYFFREARAAAQLHHPNIVAVHEIGRADDVFFIVSDFVEGVTLAEWSAKQRHSAMEVAELGATIAEALDHAHQQGVVHRDLKPANVMLDAAGEPRIMDFGLAKREVGEVTMTADGQILGTVAYMSPEQAEGKSHWTDRRTDIYSLGVMLFQFATGELPFRGNLEAQLLAKQIGEPPDPRRLDPKLPRDFAVVCLKCLQREPNSRYPTSGHVAAELRRFLAGEPIVARPLSPAHRLWRWAKRRPALAAVALLTGVLAIAGPTAALHINNQRIDLERKNNEQIELIENQQKKSAELAKQKTELEARIDELLGKVPGIERVAPGWQVQLIEQIVESRYGGSAEIAAPELDGRLELARFHSTVGFLNSAIGNKPVAIEHLWLAEAALESLMANDPHDLALLQARADCAESIAQNLDDETFRSVAIDRLLNLRKQLVELDPSSLALTEELTARWEMVSEEQLLADPAASMEPIAATMKAIVDGWPADFAKAYEAACKLTHHDPILHSNAGGQGSVR